MLPEIIGSRILENFLSGISEGKKEKEATAYGRRKDVLGAAQKEEQMRRQYPEPGETANDLSTLSPDVLDTYLAGEGKKTSAQRNADLQLTQSEANKNNTEAWRGRTYPPDSAGRAADDKAKLDLEGEKAAMAAWNEAAKTGSQSDMENAAFNSLSASDRARLDQMNAMDPTSPEFKQALAELDAGYAASKQDPRKRMAIEKWRKESPALQKYFQMQQTGSKPADSGSSLFGPLLDSIVGSFKGKDQAL